MDGKYEIEKDKNDIENSVVVAVDKDNEIQEQLQSTVDNHTVRESVKGAREKEMDKVAQDVDEQVSGWRENKVTLNLDCLFIVYFVFLNL